MRRLVSAAAAAAFHLVAISSPVMADAAAPGTAAPSSPVVSSTPHSAGLQVVYDAGQAAYDRSDWTAAAAAFVQLLPSDPAAVKGRSQGVIAYRYARSLLELGRAPEAQPWATAALGALRSAEPGLEAEAWSVTGSVRRSVFDYAGAVDAFAKAGDLLAGQGLSGELIGVRLDEAELAATVDPARGLAPLTTLMADPAYAKRVDRAVRAHVEDLAARLQLNLGHLREAEVLSRRAVDDGGGLTERASVSQVQARADAALIARLRGHDEDARQYLAYTGAGHLLDEAWISDREGALPVCGLGGDAQAVQPDDVAVVTFEITDEGRVASAIPVFANRPGPVGEDFARAIGQWRWNPRAVAKVAPLFRQTLQLELRCQRRPELKTIGERPYHQLAELVQAQGLLTPAETAFIAAGGVLSVATGDPRLKGPSGALFTVLADRAGGRPGDLTALWARLDQAQAPAAAYAALVDETAVRENGNSPKQSGRRRAQAYATWIPRFAAKFPTDPALPALRLEQAFALEEADDFGAAQPILSQLIARPPVSAGPAEMDGQEATPVRTIALLHQAIGFDRAGQAAASRQALEASGLDKAACALIDTHPVPRVQGSASFSYPNEAQLWRFDGYVLTDFDIDAQGRVTEPRAIVAYPPFIFDEASVDGVRAFRYLPPQVGGQPLGCVGQETPIIFRTNG